MMPADVVAGLPTECTRITCPRAGARCKTDEAVVAFGANGACARSARTSVPPKASWGHFMGSSLALCVLTAQNGNARRCAASIESAKTRPCAPKSAKRKT